MRIGVPAEAGQALVAATPDTVSQLIKLGYDVGVESGAGGQAQFPDEQYVRAGARIVASDEVWASDIVTSIRPPADLHQVRRGSILISKLSPGANPHLVETLAEQGVTGMAMDAIPRISRAQSMDVLSSQANVAGYRAVIEAAHAFGRLFTGQVTAAGKVPPATIYVIGAGVAGLAAIGTAGSMGAVVKATDVRAEVGEQVESMGAEFIPIAAPAQESADGYAKEMTQAQADAASQLYAEQSAEADIVITTASIPGRRSPLLITGEMVAKMKPGSVIVDMAAAGGGNCELTEPGRTIVTENGVTIIGIEDLAARLPAQASQLYAQNIVNYLKLLTPEKDGRAKIDFEDVIIRTVTVADAGQVLWPPRPIQVSATPAPKPVEAEPAAATPEPSGMKKSMIWLALAAVIGAALVLVTPLEIAGHYIVLALAIIVGYYVITNVTHALHTPLMSVTNAISGIIIVGAILLIGSSNWWVTIFSFIAIVIASINIFGGFAVTHRMLGMFRRA
ncbi:Re/Si-specific NAD(P)(+) transhydrogenase subunit alpha [Flaviflexus massiliensis]|uniref:Re/Si-specific NAD(P)(+) transhydrogenase subunit alpha n=1 Tax=Flaviflexus massiliensis TaxID=1522309 RepID=UPI0006D58100|nr:Re/Si-specific NAD(P)(+) transhydrogenase subunit alpha [Flaviflexus massiliensis]